MALTVDDKPSGFRPIGAGSLIYKFTEASLSGKPNYRVEISLNGLSTPIFEFRPDASLKVYCDIAPMLRSVLTFSTEAATRLNSTYVKYQAKWDGGSDALVSLTTDVIYFYLGYDNYLNRRSKFSIDVTGGEFLIPTSKLFAWANRTAYVDFICGGDLPANSTLKFTPPGGSTSTLLTFNGALKELKSVGYKFPSSGTLRLGKDEWVAGTGANTNQWDAICYGRVGSVDRFVAVARTGVGNRVMTSDDYGATWTPRTSAADNNWQSVAYGNGVFVAVATSGTGNRVMSSTDGITWTIRTSAADNSWQSVTFGNGKFVAVASSASSNRVMTSTNGVDWFGNDAIAGVWLDVVYGAGKFVAVGTGASCMTSFNGTDWTAQTITSRSWNGLCYGGGQFVAVATSGTGTRVATSPDGITWTLRNAAADLSWVDVEYGNGLYVAVALDGTGATKSMVSSDGITWSHVTMDNQPWNAVAFGAGRFVAVAEFTTVVDTLVACASIDVTVLPECSNPIYLKWLNDLGGISQWLFDVNQVYGFQPQDLGRFHNKQVYATDLTDEAWEMLAELIKDGIEYGDNYRAGQSVYDFTNESSPIQVLPVPKTVSMETKAERSTLNFTIRYPRLNNMMQ